jgi:hypothetical protein
MSNNAENVSLGKPKIGGAIYVAPAGTPVPTDALATLNPAFKCLGYASEDGLVNSIDAETTDIQAWGGDKVLTTRSSYSETFGFTLIESKNVDVLKTVYGDNSVTGDDLDTGIEVDHNSADLPTKAFVFEIIMSGDVLKRIVVPRAKVSEVGEVTYSDEDAIGYETTISAFPNASGSTAKEYIIAAPSA